MAASQESPSFVALVQATAGAAGGVFAAFSLMPLEVAKTRISVSRSGTTSVIGMLQEIYAKEGIPGFFSGVATKCTETGSKNFVYFYVYDALNQIVKKDVVSGAMKLMLGYLAGVATTVLTMPLEVLATKLQLPENSGLSATSAVARILQEEGIGGLFKGFGFNVMLCINPAIQNSVFDKLKDGILVKRVKQVGVKKAVLTPLEAFTLGALAKAVATVITFPLVRLKTILQAESPADGEASKDKDQEDITEPRTVSFTELRQRQTSTPEMLNVLSKPIDLPPHILTPLLRIGSLYRGMGSALFKTVLQAALLYMTKDQVESVVVRLFKLTSRVLLRKNTGKPKLGAFSGRPLAS